jgi:hypothetical protein
VQTSENAKELYDELAERIHAQDDTGARRAFRELQKTGRSRQEIVTQISLLLEKRDGGMSVAKGTEEISWLGPRRSIEPSPAEEHQKPSAWSHTPIKDTQHRFDIPVEKTSPRPEIAPTDADRARRAVAPHELSPEPQATAVSGEPEKPLTNEKAAADGENATQSFKERRGAFFGDTLPRQVGAGSGYADLSVPERVASKLNLQTVLSAGEAKQTARAEAVAVKGRPMSAQQGSRASSRKMGMVLAGTSVLPAAAAGLFVLWNLYGTELQEVSSASAHRVLTWLHEVRGTNVSSNPDTAKPTQKTGSEQATAIDERNETAKRAEEGAARPPTDRSTPQLEAAAAESAVAGRPRTRIEPNTGATSTEAAEKTSSRTETPNSHVADPAVFPAPAASRSQQSETDAAQGRQTVGPQVPPVDTGALVAQGDHLLGRSDIASARILYQRAAEAGDGRGALRMGMTFDRVFLVRWRLRAIQADRAQAISWYRRAGALGNAEAELMQREAAAQPPRVAAPGQRTSHRPRRAPATHNAQRG